MLKNSCIFSLKDFLLVFVLLRVAEQSISSFISRALAIIDTKIVLRWLLGPANLAKAEALYIHELT